MSNRKIHLICNAHLDPVWLWHWDEGAAEAISTFRVAADFCEEYNGFIFNGSESNLYQWIEKFEPALFVRIQRLVMEGKWHIMGGWYVQPDCNMPSGESFVRQISFGKQYFKDKFGVLPTTAINFDPFGHTRGLVQIMKKSGYDSYLFCRPLKIFRGNNVDVLGYDEFKWVGFDGSELLAHRGFKNYLSGPGKAASKIQEYIDTEYGESDLGAVLWGIGNHGGGPSKADLDEIEEMINRYKNEIEIVHSTPEEYFKELALSDKHHSLPVRKQDLNPWAVGGYTTQIRIKQQYRLLESQLYVTEKMLAHASMAGRIKYPKEELRLAEEDLVFAQFHDILPGTTIQPAEKDSLQMISHGLEILSRLKTQAFFALADGQPKAEDDTLPIMVYNPHPYPVDSIFECGFSMSHMIENKKGAPRLFKNGKEVICQFEQPHSHNYQGGRRRLIARALLDPSSMNRFTCHFDELPEVEAPPSQIQRKDGQFVFNNGTLTAAINTTTGLLDSYCVRKKAYLKPQAFRLLVVDDDAHSIGTFSRHYRDVIGAFELMSSSEGTRFSGVTGRVLDSVRIIEHGPVRTIVEAVFRYGNSNACVKYHFPAQGSEVELEIRIHWNEKCKMLKLSIPTCFSGNYIGQTAFGSYQLPQNGNETVAQQWTAIVCDENDAMASVINNGTYGSDYLDGEMRLSLLRSPRFGNLTPRERRSEMYNRGYVPHVDQGEHLYRFWINAGNVEDRMRKIGREAQERHEQPYVLSFYPSGQGELVKGGICISNDVIVVSAFKKAEKNGYVLRLFNPLDTHQSTGIKSELGGFSCEAIFSPYEVKTWLVDDKTGQLCECDMMENPLHFEGGSPSAAL